MKRKAITFGLSAILSIGVTGCAHKPSNAKIDPYEGFNRVIFAFNQDVDHLVYRPATTVYTAILPPIMRKGITHVFDNIGELTTLPNDLMQGKFKYVFLDFWRFVINSTVGVGGLFDVAKKLGLPRHYNDFGMTLAYWSHKNNSPYFQIPFLGPSTFRDTLGLAFDYAMSPYPYLHPDGWKYYPQAVRFVDIRANLMNTDQLVDEAFDPYIFVRNAYLQHRNATIAANNKNGLGKTESPALYRTAESTPAPLPSPDDKPYQQ